MKKFTFLSLALTLSAIPSFAYIKGDIVDLTYDLKGEIVRLNGGFYDVAVFGNPDNMPSGSITIQGNYGIGSDLFTVTSIRSGAFENSSLTFVNLEKEIHYIGESAFYNCQSLVGIGEMEPGSIWTIGQYAFEKTYALESVAFPGVVQIGEFAFRNSKVKSVAFTGVKRILAGAFQECHELETFIGGEQLESLGNTVFVNCDKLTGMTLGPNLTSIGSMTFAFCGALNEIVIPENVETIGQDAFQGLAMDRVFILSPSIMASLDGCKILRNQHMTHIYCPSAIIGSIKQYLETGSDANPLWSLATGAEVLTLSDVVSLDPAEIPDYYYMNTHINGISNVKIIDPLTDVEMQEMGGSYNIFSDNVVLQYRVDDINLLRYTYTLPPYSAVESISSDSLDNASKPVYYDLCGRVVLNPSNGIFILRAGDKSKKVVL